MKMFTLFAALLTVSLSTSLAAAQDRVVVIPLPSARAAANDGFLTLPAPAFRPFASDSLFSNQGRYLFHQGGTNLYIAPVNLPQNSTVTKMTFHYYDNEISKSTVAKLQRTEFGIGDFPDMAIAESELVGNGPVYDDTIDYAVIDNRKYGYWVILVLPAGDIAAVSVIIDYSN